MQKPTKPTVTLPEGFGGTKYEFDADRLLSGYKEGIKDVVDGGNLNYLIDGIGKIVNYNKQLADFIRDMPIGKIPTVDTNNNLVYGENKMTLPVGSLQSSTLPLMDNIQYLLADGSQYSRTGAYQAFADYLAQVQLTYPQCFVTQAQFDYDVANFGQCGRYVLETTYFRLPKITRYIGATINLADIGKAWGESLPNIKGSTRFATGTSINDTALQDGAFSKGDVNTNGVTSSAVGQGRDLLFNAHLSNPSYIDGAKVNNERITYPYYIVVSNAGQMTPVEIDINQVLNELALRANTNADNFTQIGRELITGLGVKDLSRKYVATIPVGGYTMPFDSYVFSTPTTPASTFANLVEDESIIDRCMNPVGSSQSCAIRGVIKKGSVVKITTGSFASQTPISTGVDIFPLKGSL